MYKYLYDAKIKGLYDKISSKIIMINYKYYNKFNLT
jgi:hypothetical protein